MPSGVNPSFDDGNSFSKTFLIPSFSNSVAYQSGAFNNPDSIVQKNTKFFRVGPHGSKAGQAAPQFPLQSIDSENFQATTPTRKEKIHHTCMKMMMGLH